MKRLVSIVLCLVMLAGLLPVVAMADSKSSGYRITKGSELYEELGKLAEMCGDTTDDAVAAVNRWLSGKEKILNDEDMSEETKKLAAGGDLERFVLDNFYTNVILFEAMFNYGALSDLEPGDDGIDTLKCILDNSLPIKDDFGHILQLIKESKEKNILEISEANIKIRQDVLGLLAKAMDDDDPTNIIEELRQRLQAKAVYGGANDIYERLQTYMNTFSAVAGLTEDAQDEEIEFWEMVSGNIFDEWICDFTVKMMSLMNVLDWEEKSTAKLEVFLNYIPVIMPEIVDYFEAVRDKDYLKVINLSAKLNEEEKSMFEEIFDGDEKLEEEWKTECKRLLSENTPKDNNVAKDLTLLAAGAVLGRVVQTTAKVTVRMLVAPAVGVLLLTGAARMLRNLTPTFIPRVF